MPLEKEAYRLLVQLMEIKMIRRYTENIEYSFSNAEDEDFVQLPEPNLSEEEIASKLGVLVEEFEDEGSEEIIEELKRKYSTEAITSGWYL